MNLAEKIELLKSQLNELDENLKEVDTACKESSDCFDLVNESVGENLSQKDVKVLADVQKQVIANNIDRYIIHSRIIRKISPEIASLLEKKIDEFGKNYRAFYDVVTDPQTSKDDHIRTHKSAKRSVVEIQNIVYISRTITRDILGKFEK